MAGVTKEEIARAKELDLLTYFKLVEPSNLKLVGKEYRHKVHSSLTISKDSLWCWHCIGLRGRTALKYLIDVEKVPYVEAVREINRIQGGVVHSSQPVSLPQPRAEPEAPRDFKLPNTYFNCDIPIRGEWYGQSDRLDASTNSGNYFIRELRAPLGYYLNDAEMDVTFTYDGEVLQVLDSTCANKPTEMWVSKRDLTNDEELPGATLIIKDAKDNIVDTWVSTDTPHRVTGLHFDEEYTLTEKRPADGYAVADDIVFRLERKADADGHELDEADVYYLKDKKKLWIIPWEKWELLDDATVILRDDITRVQISKVDIATGKELPGAELVIKDKDGNTVTQWVSEDKPHYIEKLPAGEYALTEITAPNGYQLAESIAFTVLPTGELQTVVMKDARIPEETPHEDSPSNTPQPTPNSTPTPAPAPASAPTATSAPMPVIPQTGDVFPFALLSAVVFGSIVGFGIFAYKRRKSKLDESEH